MLVTASQYIKQIRSANLNFKKKYGRHFCKWCFDQFTKIEFLCDDYIDLKKFLIFKLVS